MQAHRTTRRMLHRPCSSVVSAISLNRTKPMEVTTSAPRSNWAAITGGESPLPRIFASCLRVKNMKATLQTVALLSIALSSSFGLAQVASHAPTLGPTAGNTVATASAPAPAPSMQVTEKAVARVNGIALTDRDLLREML